MVNRNGRLEPEVADNQSPNQQVQPQTVSLSRGTSAAHPEPRYSFISRNAKQFQPSAPAVQHVMYLASPSSTQAGYIQHAPSPFIGIPYITQTPQHAQQTPAVVLVPQPNSHNFNGKENKKRRAQLIDNTNLGQHLQLIPGPAPMGN